MSALLRRLEKLEAERRGPAPRVSQCGLCCLQAVNKARWGAQAEWKPCSDACRENVEALNAEAQRIVENRSGKLCATC